MTLEEFYAELAPIAKRLELWEARFKVDGVIRCAEGGWCPIVALFREKMPLEAGVVNNAGAFHAARRMGLSSDDFNLIVAAADDRPVNTEGIQVRERLLSLFGVNA